MCKWCLCTYRQDKKRPRQLLTNDGHHVLNLWFIPHYTEALIMFKNLSDERIVRALSFSLSIVSSIHDMLQYLWSHARLGSSHARLGSQGMEYVSADWEGIGRKSLHLAKGFWSILQPKDMVFKNQICSHRMLPRLGKTINPHFNEDFFYVFSTSGHRSENRYMIDKKGLPKI